MTIKVTITNDDTRDTALIAVETHHLTPDGVHVSPHPSEGCLLKGGQSVQLHVHSSIQLVVKEVSQG